MDNDKTQATSLLIAIQSRGCDARDIRDAAHEATHALQSKLRGPWERERLHDALERKAKASNDVFIAQMLRFELQARAVEMLVCKHFNVEYDQEHFALMCLMETVKTYHVDIGGLDKVIKAINIVSNQTVCRLFFNRVLAIKPLRSKVL